ncbi:MAG: hypothetical protein HYV95_01695 [Opitutae bacterium]|nr:hypothetical protein [Opitutae bacterium]
MSAIPHPGWAAAHERISVNWALLRQRVAAARLAVGAAAPALTEEQYGAFLGQQITMIRECSRSLVTAAARLSATANAYDPALPATVIALDQACRDFMAGPEAVADWTEAMWRTTPPLRFARNFEALREIPAAIIAQLEPFFQTVADAAEGRVSADRKIDIDIQPLIDRATRLGNLELAAHRGGSSGCLTPGLGILAAVLVVLSLLTKCS